MSENFYDHFKNKDLKNMFRRLCIQNQQRKSNTLWQMLDQLTVEQVKVRHHVEALAGAVSLLIIFAYIYNHIHKIIHVFVILLN